MSQYNLTKTDKNKWVRNLKRFTAPMLIVYVSQLSMVLSNGNVPQAIDLVPNAITQGAIWGYVLSSALDLFTKWSAK